MDRDNLITKLNQYLVNNRSCGNGGMNTYRVVESIEKLPREVGLYCDRVIMQVFNSFVFRYMNSFAYF